ncbi:Bloom syndrome -like, partial [Paramuricea clavata]
FCVYNFNTISQLKEYQRQTIEAYLSGRDVFVSIWQRYEKSLTFELAPHAFEYLSENNKSLVLVVVPLVSLMKDQVSNLVSRGIPSSYIGDDCSENQLKSILDFKSRIVFGSPKALLNNYRYIFRHLKENLKAVFIDESHCITKWGKDSLTEEAFRSDYGRLAELRSLVHKNQQRQHGRKDLCMRDCVQIIGDPNKQNIKDVDSLVKKTVETEFCKENGTVRVVFCTIAFGMGVNVNVVIHLGPSGGLDDYLQESGRVGRDKANAHAILLKYKGCTCNRNITKQMKEYVRNTTECRRVLLLKLFVSNPQPNAILHSCCDICAGKCKCLCICPDKEQCACTDTCNPGNHQSTFENLLNSVTNVSSVNEKTSRKKLKGENARQLREDILEYRLQLAGNMTHEQLLIGLDLATGFTRSLIHSIVENARNISSMDILLEKFNFFERKQADSSSDDGDENEEIEPPSEDNEFEDSELEDYDIEHTVTRCGHLRLSGSSEDNE